MSNSKIFQRCTVFGCKTTNRDKIKLHSIPENLSDEWDKVIRHRKPINWKPKKRTVICGLHFNKNFLSGPTLLPGATPTIEPVADVVQIGMYKSFAKGVDRILAGGDKKF